MVDKSGCPQSCYCADHCQPSQTLSQLSCIGFVFYGLRHSFSYWLYLMLLHRDCILLKINFNVVMLVGIILCFPLLVLHVFVQSNRYFEVNMDSIVHDSSVCDGLVCCLYVSNQYACFPVSISDVSSL